MAQEYVRDSWDRAGDESGASPRARRAEALVTRLAVVAVVVAAVSAALMQPRGDDEHPGASSSHVLPATALHGRTGAPCLDCGVVEAVIPLPQRATAYQVHIRMDDGSLRTVEQRGAPATGTRVVLARGALRVMRGPARQG